MGNDSISDALHRELCTALAELAKSVDIASKRMALRAKFTAAITDARKAEKVAEALRAAAIQKSEIFGSADATTNLKRDRKADAIQQLNDVCSWLKESANAAPTLASRQKEACRQSLFAQSLLELHDRTGGFLNRV